MKIGFYVSCYIVRKQKNNPKISGLEIYADDDKYQTEVLSNLKKVEELILEKFMALNPELKKEYYCEFTAEITKRGIISEVDNVIFRPFTKEEIAEYSYWEHLNSRSDKE